MKTGARPDSLAVLGCRFLRTDRSNPRASTIEFLPLIDIKTKWPTFRMRHFIFFSLVEFPIWFVSSGLIDYQSVLVHVKAWCWTGEKQLFGQLMAPSTDIYKHHYFIISLTKASLDGCHFQLKRPAPFWGYSAVRLEWHGSFRQREHGCRTPRTSGSVVPVRQHE